MNQKNKNQQRPTAPPRQAVAPPPSVPAGAPPVAPEPEAQAAPAFPSEERETVTDVPQQAPAEEPAAEPAAPTYADLLRNKRQAARNDETGRTTEIAAKLWADSIAPALENAALADQGSIMWSPPRTISTPTKDAILALAQAHGLAGSWGAMNKLLLTFE